MPPPWGPKVIICPLYPHSRRKRPLKWAVSRNNRKKGGPVSVLGRAYEISMAWEPDCRYNWNIVNFDVHQPIDKQTDNVPGVIVMYDVPGVIFTDNVPGIIVMDNVVPGNVWV